jgi:hypothetical protein
MPMASQPNRLKNNGSALFSLCLDRVPSKGQLYESMLCLKTILSQIGFLEPLEPKWYHANDEGHTFILSYICETCVQAVHA